MFEESERTARGIIRAIAAGMLTLTALGFMAEPAIGQPAAFAWMDKSLSPDARADLVVEAMTLDEKILLVHGHAPLVMRNRPPDVTPMSGYVPGIPRLGIPPQKDTDAGMGVVSPSIPDRGDGSTVLPAGIAQAATWNPATAYAGGAMLGTEAHRRGYNVLLAGGMNLARDPRNGRTFEYAGEDPLLAGTIVGNEVSGIQDQHVVSTVKHFVINDQETGRGYLNARIDEAALRESDLLAFEIAIEQGDPGSVMCAYNRVRGVYACENPEILDDILKGDWKYPGWVISDWGATHSATAAAIAGLDQEAGEEFDGHSFFDAPLRAAATAGEVPQARLDDMVHRILRSLFANGAIDDSATPPPVDYVTDADTSQHTEEEAIVLLRNTGNALPLTAGAKKIAIIGGHADAGVLGGGGGSSEVPPYGGTALRLRGGQGDWPVYEPYFPSSPLKAIAARLPGASVTYNDGSDPAAAATFARGADVAIVFATQWMTESADVPNLSLPSNQDALIAAVAAANPHTIVVLETGGPVLMPWLDKSAAVLEAWYSGSRGGEAIARVLFGEVNPSGRLPVTFPASETQLVRPDLPGSHLQLHSGPIESRQFDVDYPEGSNVGYRWFEAQSLTPLFPFGFGLSYTQFTYGEPEIASAPAPTVRFTVTNTGTRAGAETAQVYGAKDAPGAVRHLIGWSKVALAPHESKTVTIVVDRRLLATFDVEHRDWHVTSGPYRITIGRFAGDAQAGAQVIVAEQHIKP